MPTYDPRIEEAMRQGSKYLNRFVVLLWRLELGRWINAWPEMGGRILVLTHFGRKSGRRYRTPLGYAIADGNVYCVAEFGGVTDWYCNLKANPEVEVWLPDGWWAGVAEEVTDAEARLPLLRQVWNSGGVAGRTLRFDPRTMTDEEFEAATAHHRLIRIRRTGARTGAGGPGDLSWVWQVATLILLTLSLFQRTGNHGENE